MGEGSAAYGLQPTFLSFWTVTCGSWVDLAFPLVLVRGIHSSVLSVNWEFHWHNCWAFGGCLCRMTCGCSFSSSHLCQCCGECYVFLYLPFSGGSQAVSAGVTDHGTLFYPANTLW